MRFFTELNLGKTDPGLRQPDAPYDIVNASQDTARIEDLGFDGIIVAETNEDPFVALTLAAQATDRLSLTTAVAMAFPRAPAIMAMTAWGLQRLSKGRFTLGLGSQVRGHIVRRFGLEFSPIGPWMRDYVGAVRAVWDCWQNRTKLDYHSDRYELNLMVPLFDPGPIEWPAIPIQLAAVNRYICQVAGEVADGIRPHGMCTPDYIKKVMLPAAAEGAERAGRDPETLTVAMKPLVASGSDDESLAHSIEDVRARIAFYASTPTYRPCLEMYGLGDLARHMSTLSREQRWEELPALVDDKFLDTFAIVGRSDEIGAKLLERFGDILDEIVFSPAVDNADDMAAVRGMIETVQAA
jgi:probable F420-dependent oxidoreductase